jgi:alpha-D-xyloside xylohydrolase
MFHTRNQRTYGLVRGTNSGGVAFPYVIYNDCYSHRDFITGLCNCGFLGVLWTPEARSAASAEEWLRRIQTTCFSPLAMINAWADATKPWSFPEVEAAVREVMVLRQRLAPYLYSAFARYHFEGLPPFRAMALEGDALTGPAALTQGELDATDNPYAVAAAREIKDQYLMGDCLLVAPLFAGETQRQVWLPPGGWCDFYTGERFEGGRDLTIAPGLERIPVFVRDGGIVPLLAEGVAGCGSPALEVRHYGQAEGRFLLYDDDGETYDYEQGSYSWTELAVTRDAKGTLAGGSRILKESPIRSYGELHWRFMTP